MHSRGQATPGQRCGSATAPTVCSMATFYDAADVQELLSLRPNPGQAGDELGSGAVSPTHGHAAGDTSAIDSRAPDSSRSDDRACQTGEPVGSHKATS